MSEQIERAKLIAAEAALVDLTDECGGSCAFDGAGCLCSDKLWPAIEAVRELIAASVRGQ